MSTSQSKPVLRFSFLALLGLIGAGGWWLLAPAEDARLAREDPAGRAVIQVREPNRPAPPDSGAGHPRRTSAAQAILTAGSEARDWGLLTPAAKRYRPLDLDFQVFTAKTLTPGQSINWHLFEDVFVQTRVTRMSTDANGTLQVQGTIEGSDHGYAIVTRSGDQLFATLSHPEVGQEFVIMQRGPDNTHYVLEVDRARSDIDDSCAAREAEEQVDLASAPIEESLPPASLEPLSLSGGEGGASGSDFRVDVLVVYTPAALEWADENGGINNIIAQAMQKGQLALDNSDVPIQLRMVHSEEVDYTEVEKGADLDALTYPIGHPNDIAGEMDNVFILRNQYGADLVALLESNPGTGGIGWILRNTNGDAAKGYSLTRIQQAATGFTFIHELGHNMGCHHSRNQDDQKAPASGGLYDYSTGWRWTGTDDEGYASVMTYSEGDTRAPLFSSPDINYMGTPAGSYDGNNSFAPADNARSLRDIDFVISQYRAEKTIFENPITLLSPIGGEYWPIGSTRTIRWSSGFVLTVKIELSLNGGASWTTLASSAPAGLGRFTWTVPDMPTSEGKIRVSISYATEFFDTTPGTFSIVPPPNGDWESSEVRPFELFSWRDVEFLDAQNGWLAGSGYNFDSTRTEFHIWRTSDGGLNWSPQSMGDDYSPYDLFMLDANRGWFCATRFTSSGTDTLIYRTVNGGADWEAVGLLDDHFIHALHFTDANTGWAAGRLTFINAGEQILKRTTNGGQTWVTVQEFGFNELRDVQMINANQGWAAGGSGNIYHDSDGSGTWGEQTVDTSKKIHALDFIDANHGWMVGDGGLAIRTVNGGSSWVVENSGTVAALNDVGFVNPQKGWAVGLDGVLLNTVDGGQTWAQQDSKTSSELYAVSMVDELTGFASGADGTFLKYTGFPPVLNLTSPNGGETWFATTTRTITWEAAYFPGDVRIEFSSNNGVSWSTLATRPATDQSYDWTLSQAPTTQGRIRIVSVNDSSLMDTSSGSFTIRPALDLLSPDGGESLGVGSRFDITWQTILSNPIKIEFSSNNGASWSTVEASVSAFSSPYRWDVPEVASSQCRIRISNTSNPSIQDTSTTTFSTFQSELLLVEPNGGESWPMGSTQNIRWNGSNIDTVRLDYSINDGTQWILITNGFPAAPGSFSWIVPPTPSTEARVRVIGQGGTAATVISDEFFRIEPDLSNTTFYASRDTGGASVRLTVNGTVVYIADFASGVEAFDFTDPADPVQVMDFKPPGNTWDIAVRLPYAYLAIGSSTGSGSAFSGLQIYNISDPGNPQEVASVATTDRAYGIELEGDHAYLMAGTNGLRVINVADPLAPEEVGFFPVTRLVQSGRVVGDLLYLLEYSQFTETSLGPSFLRILDISTPASPSELGFLEMPGSAQSLDVLNNHAYLAHWNTNYQSIKIVNVANPSQPQEVNEYVVPDIAFGVTVHNDLLHFGYQGGGLRILSLESPTAPEEVAWCVLKDETALLSSLAVSGNLVFVGNSISGLMVVGNDYIPPAPPTPLPAILGPTSHTAVAGEPTEIILDTALYQRTTGVASWQAAEAEAILLRGHLAAITSALEQRALEELFMSGENDRKPYWVGLNDQLREGTFAWSSGERLGYQNWKPGEPNDFGGDEDYVAINWEHARNVNSPKGTWNDAPNEGSRGFGGFTDGPYHGIMEIPFSGNQSFSASGLPGGLSIDPRRGRILGTPEETGIFSATIRLKVGVGQETATALVRFNIVPYTYDVWMSRLSGTNLPPVALRGPEHDPDRDSLSNFGEYVANYLPMQPNQDRGYTVNLSESGGRQYLFLSYRLHRRATDAFVLIQRSESLVQQNWTKTGVVPVSIVPIDSETDEVTVRSAQPVSETQAEYFLFTVGRR